MENLEIAGTMSSPRVMFINDGNLLIEGRSIPDNAIKAFEPMFNWIDSFTSEKVRFAIKLEYLNTSSSMQLFGLLKILEDNFEIKEIEVIWHYDEDDEEHFETGQIFSEQLQRTHFIYQSEIAC
jgi:hypothetical protein